MQLGDDELIRRLKIRPADRILDVGGSMRQHGVIKVDTLVDTLRPERTPYVKSPLRAGRFVKVDITQDGLPFGSKEFDVCLCTHTLEDLYNPFLILKEMGRVAKRGYIATPSRGKDMEFSRLNLTEWNTGWRRQPGLAHHYWFFENRKGRMYIVPKNYPLLYTSEFWVETWLGEDEMRYFWNGEIKFKTFTTVDFHGLIDEYRNFMKSHQGLIKKGRPLVYLDSPHLYLKEMVKKLVKRGAGFNRN